MKITIIGCGNSGLIHAAKLIEKGHEVALLKTSNLNGSFFDKIKNEMCFRVKDDTIQGNGREFVVRPAMVTRNTKEAVTFADMIMVMTTTLQHTLVAELIAPYVRDGQIIILTPGYMGSLIFKKFIKKDVTYCEWETTAYNGRIVNSEYVRISFCSGRNCL